MEIDSSDSNNLRTILKIPKFPLVYPGPAFRDFCSAGRVRLAAVSAILLIRRFGFYLVSRIVVIRAWCYCSRQYLRRKILAGDLGDIEFVHLGLLWPEKGGMSCRATGIEKT